VAVYAGRIDGKRVPFKLRAATQVFQYVYGQKRIFYPGAVVDYTFTFVQHGGGQYGQYRILSPANADFAR
jgi:hypothetical protein